MPLIVQHNNSLGSSIYLWRLDEDILFFKAKVDINDAKWAEVITWVEDRRKEWIAGRYLIQQYANCSSKALQIDPYGKPHISTPQHISLSHSGQYVALYISNNPCGIDIQVTSPTIRRISHKFMSDGDHNLFSSLQNEERLHVIWSIKEAIYKAYGKKKLDFKKNININITDHNLIGKVIKEHIELDYKLDYKIIDQIYLATAECQIDPDYRYRILSSR